ncbi:MAG: DUF5684 domain-containing protein, partial [Verrucomicrobia bacterium]|nr:DUF5684 domain-containing protein [Verrucomicrobiota bacterium]
DLPPEVREKLGYAKTSKPKDGANSAEEQRFDLLQIGTRRYTNVTVTTKTTNYIFIVHAAGMASLKVAELPLEVREKLGYVKRRPLAGTNSAVAWAKMEIAKLKVPQIKELKNQLNQRWGSEKPIKERTVLGMKTYPFLLVASLFALAVHLFQCYCCILICEKTGNEPGVLIWLPVLQLIPLLRAAGMSGWWFVAFFVPLLNLVAWILWSFNIAKARSKSIWVGVLLLLPLTSLFAFLYLAFSDGGAPEQEEKEDDSGIVTLEMVWGLIGLTTVMGHLSFWVLM